MTGCERYTDLIGDEVDGTLDVRARPDLEQHLAACPSCRALLADLRRIRAAAGQLERLEPPAHVWPRLARRIEAERATGRPGGHRVGWLGPAWRFGLAAAAVVAVAVVSGWAVWLVDHRGAGPAVQTPAAVSAAAPATAAAGATPAAVAGELKLAAEHYEKAIAGLQQIARAGEGSLDPKVAEALQQNLAVIDQAIAQSRAALQTQPASEPAQASLLDAFRTKVGLLQETIELINEMRKGNEAGAARIMQGMKKS